MAKKSKMMKVKEVGEDESYYVILYARVSTDKQAEEGYSIDIQKERLDGYAKAMFVDKPCKTKLLVDDGYSGGDLNRPGMQELIEIVENENPTHVVVVKLDRLSRSQKDTLYLIEDVFLPRNVDFVSMQESFNTATSFGRAVVGILSVFAQFERENIYERTRGGLKKRVSLGYWPGGGGVPFGYDYDQIQGILVPNSDADTVRQVFFLYVHKGYSLQHIANILHLKYEALAKNIIKRKTYIGIIVYNGVEYKGKHEPLIDEETFYMAQAILERRSLARTNNIKTQAHLLTGLVYCGECGAKMRYMKWGPHGEYRLVCYSHMKSKPYMVKDPNCPSANIPANEVEQAVIEQLFDLTAAHFETMKETEKDDFNIRDALEAKVKTLSTKLRRLYQLYGDDGDAQLLDLIEDVKADLATAKSSLESEMKMRATDESLRLTVDNYRSLKLNWDSLPVEEKRRGLESIISKIIVKGSKVSIDYTI